MKKNPILIICPSRGRGNSIESFYKNFKENSVMSDIVFSLDDDDDANYFRYEDANTFYEVGFRNEIVPAINYVAYKYAQNSQYEFIGIINDDHRIRTYGWDKIIYDTIKNNKLAIAYPNDLYPESKDNYASCVIMSFEIINCLGYMANPTLKHFYPDAIWISIGKALNSLFYFKDVIVEHMHYTINKSEKDELYEHVGNFSDGKIAVNDRKVYNEYKELFLENDILKLSRYIQNDK